MSIFDTRCRALAGLQLTTLRGFEFPHDKISAAANAFFFSYLPPFTDRKYVLRLSQTNLGVRLHRFDSDIPPADHVMTENRRYWEAYLGKVQDAIDVDLADLDQRIRSVEYGDKSGKWAIRKTDGKWSGRPANEVRMVLQADGHPKQDAERIMGRACASPWRVTCVPFGPAEDATARTWNIDAPQLRYQPVAGDHPHWNLIFDHVGSDLNSEILKLAWAQQVGIVTGGDYLRAIFASIIRHPFEPTPYLFLFGPEDSGKSILHEAFELLVTGGVVKADRALTSQSDFNGELAGAILCVVEEKDIGKTPGAYAKIKDAVTARQLSIRRMYTDSYMVDNTTHWIQAANHIDACPRALGDTRICCIEVQPPKQKVGKELLMERLKAEAPAITASLLSMTLPDVKDSRLRIPLVENESSRKVSARSVDDRLGKLIELIETSWEGSAPELAKLVERIPADFRSLRGFLERHRFELQAVHIDFDEVQQDSKHKGAKRLKIWKRK